MKRIGHWTPRYVVDRVVWELYQRQDMDRPWLTPRSTELLSTLLLPGDIGLEWGSGRSTSWFAARLGHLTSVEDSEEWYARVQRRLADRGVDNVNYRYAPSPPDSEDARKSEYVAIAASFSDASLGFVLVDGSAREYCVEAVLAKVALGGVLVIDNANWYLDHPTHSPASRVGRGPQNDVWAALAQSLSRWRLIWTSQGVTDTAIYIRPGGTDRAASPR